MITDNTSQALEKIVPQADDFLPLLGTDFVELYVGNAKQAAYFYASCFGFQIAQISDLTTGAREEARYLLTQGNIRIVLTTGLCPDCDCQDGAQS